MIIDMRLDKYLADMHVGSRQEVKQLIRKGRVNVNGVAVKDPGFSVPADAGVTVDGEKIVHREHFYYMLNKPAGILSATEDSSQQTVLDLFPEKLRRNLFPVGRLDKDTVGLLLITDDGDLAHRLLAPKSHVDKVYLLHTDTPMNREDVLAAKEGMTLEDGTGLMPALLDISPEDPQQARITIREGKYHQIKRMLASRGHLVTYLKRLSMGSLVLDPTLPEGQYRELTEEELLSLL